MSAANLSSVRKTVFNPLLRTPADISAYLRSLPSSDGTAHPLNGSLLLLEDDVVRELDISGVDESYFLSATDLNTLSETITARIEAFSARLEKFKGFQIISLVSPYLEVPLVSGENVFIALSVRDPTFYDFCVGTANGDLILYSHTANTNLPGLRHSGDVNEGGLLLQYVVGDDGMTEEPFALFVSGYSYNALHRYKPQQPAVTIADHHANILYVIPIPLDEATIGNATLCVPVVGRRRGDKLCFSVLPAAVTSDQVATSRRLPGDTIARAIAREPPPPPPPQPTDSSRLDKPDEKKAKTGEDAAAQEVLTTVQVDTAKPLFVTEEGCTLPSFAAGHDGNHITFFQGITVHPSPPEYIRNDDKKVLLPCALGNPLEGPTILALGKPFNGAADVTLEQYTRIFDKASVVVFTVSDRMTDQARVLNPDVRCNALFIVQPRNAALGSQTNNLTVEDMLNDLKINAITSLAGPQSIVTIQLGDRYYFYRGICWPNLLLAEGIPKFGDDITEAVEAVLESQDALNKHHNHPWKNIVSIGGEPKVYFRDIASSPEELYATFSSLPLEDLSSFKTEIMDVLTQLQAVLSPKELPEFTSKLQIVLREKMDNVTAPYRKAYMDVVVASKGRERDPKLMEKYRRMEKTTKAAAQWFVDALGALVSSRISSTRQYDLKQLIRRQKIQDNVAASKEMTYDGLAELLEEHCTEIGVVIANIDNERFRTLLGKTKDKVVLQYLQELQSADDKQENEKDNKICKLDDRIQYLNSLDCGVILPVSQADHSGPLAAPTGQLSLSVPYGVLTDTSGSAFVFPCFDQFINIKHPYSQHWVELCNVHHVSMLRILQRNTISAAVQSREHMIPPASTDLGFALAYALMDAMSSLAAARSGVPAEAKKGDELDTTTNMMRGLFGYLMTLLASGVRPLSMAWQMLSRTAAVEVPPPNEMWLYVRIARLFPYTAWPRAQLAKNMRVLVARILRKQVTDPATNGLRLGVNQMKLDVQNKQIETRNTVLKWGEVAVEVLSRLILGGYAQGDAGQVKAIAKRMVDLVPGEELAGKSRKGNRGIVRIMRAFNKLAETGDVAKIDHETRLTAANTHAKRSAALKELKSKLVDAVVAKDAPTAKQIVEEIQQNRREIAARYGVETVKLQNQKNIDTALDKLDSLEPKEVLRLLKSDAEIYRNPWAVGKPSEPKPSLLHLADYVLSGDVAMEQGENSGAVQPITDALKTLDARLSAMPGGDKAGKLARMVENITDMERLLKVTSLQEGGFLELFRYGNGRTEVEEVKVLIRMVIIYLEGWQDSVAAEAKVVQYLSGGEKGEDEDDTAETAAQADAKTGVTA
ncbi:hypothetical protein DRE_04822 [Drechslerella stenobrocha 248]|uniref:Uncharacterized protein n=1 Tax=Drechslerella stenobrocha 248 TaxID=1043628 RepID=W7HS73_9PEZI|nr:hypothetical protein DRE_04822 [Drechslerella stenobrocha 248]